MDQCQLFLTQRTQKGIKKEFCARWIIKAKMCKLWKNWKYFSSICAIAHRNCAKKSLIAHHLVNLKDCISRLVFSFFCHRTRLFGANSTPFLRLLMIRILMQISDLKSLKMFKNYRIIEDDRFSECWWVFKWKHCAKVSEESIFRGGVRECNP